MVLNISPAGEPLVQVGRGTQARRSACLRGSHQGLLVHCGFAGPPQPAAELSVAVQPAPAGHERHKRVCRVRPGLQGMSGPGDDVAAQVEKAPVPPNPRMAAPGSTRAWSSFYVSALRPKVAPGTFESRKAFLSMSDSETAASSSFAPYSQYEVRGWGVGPCLQGGS